MNNPAAGEPVTADHVPSADPTPDAQLRSLIVAAFERARASGKQDWTVMTVAVLKNRLLGLTSHEFSEELYGASSMSDLARQASDLLELDDSVKPPKVTLREPEAIDKPLPVSSRIRRDLWDAMVDYSRGEPYVWSGENAVPKSVYVGDGDPPVFSTLTRQEESGWRAEFVQRISPSLAPGDRQLVEQWRDRHQSVKALPASLQREWNGDFKARIVDRLHEWFASFGIAEPADILTSARKDLPSRPGGNVEELRALVIKCVQNMTAAELSELRLSPQTLLRSQH